MHEVLVLSFGRSRSIATSVFYVMAIKSDFSLNTDIYSKCCFMLATESLNVSLLSVLCVAIQGIYVPYLANGYAKH